MYLFGTIHLGNNSFYPLDPIVEEAFDQSDVALPEINTNDSSMDQETLMKLAMFEDDTTLDQVLSHDLYSELTVLLESYDLNIKDFHAFEPLPVVYRIWGNWSNFMSCSLQKLRFS